MAKDKTPNAPSLPRAASGQILRAQKAIVTGANSGIGRGVAIALGAAGADVHVNFYSGEEAAQAVVISDRNAQCQKHGLVEFRLWDRSASRSNNCRAASTPAGLSHLSDWPTTQPSG